MKRTALITVLSLGMVAGFGSTLFNCHYHRLQGRQAFEEHIADVCMRAAERARDHSPRPENRP